MPYVKSIKNLNCPCINISPPPPSSSNTALPPPPPPNQQTSCPPPQHTNAPPPPETPASPPYYFHPSPKSHPPLYPPLLAPPPPPNNYFSPVPSSPPFNALETGGIGSGGGSNHHTTLIAVCASLSGVFFLAFLSVGILFSAKKIMKLPTNVNPNPAPPATGLQSQRAPGAAPKYSYALDQETTGGSGKETGGRVDHEAINTKGKGSLHEELTEPAREKDHGGRSALPEKGNGGDQGTTTKAGEGNLPKEPTEPPPHGGEDVSSAPPENVDGDEGTNTKAADGDLPEEATEADGGEDGGSAGPENVDGGGGDEGITDTKAADGNLLEEATETDGGEDGGSVAPENVDGGGADDGDLPEEAIEEDGGEDGGSAPPENVDGGGGDEGITDTKAADGDLPDQEANTEVDGGKDGGTAEAEDFDGGKESGDGDLPGEKTENYEEDGGPAATDKVDGEEENTRADNRVRKALKIGGKKIAALTEKKGTGRGRGRGSPSISANNQMMKKAGITMFGFIDQDIFSPTNDDSLQAGDSSATHPTDDHDHDHQVDESSTPTDHQDIDNSNTDNSKNEVTDEQFHSDLTEGSGDGMSRVPELRPQTQGVDRKILVADHQSHKKKAQQHSKNTQGKKVVPHTQKAKFPKSSEYPVPPSVHYYYHGFDSCLQQISAHLAAILDRDAGLDDLPQQPNQGDDEQVKEEETQEEEAKEKAQEEETEVEEETENPHMSI